MIPGAPLLHEMVSLRWLHTMGLLFFSYALYLFGLGYVPKKKKTFSAKIKLIIYIYIFFFFFFYKKNGAHFRIKETNWNLIYLLEDHADPYKNGIFSLWFGYLSMWLVMCWEKKNFAQNNGNNNLWNILCENGENMD